MINTCPNFIRQSIRFALLQVTAVSLTGFAAPFDPLTGWPAQTFEIIFSSPAIGPHGEVVFGTKTGDVDLPGGPDGNVYSFHPNGTLKWKFSGTDWFESSPAIAEDGTVYIAGWDNHVYAINGQTGAQIWSFATGSAVTATPVIGPDGTVYVGSTDGKMYAITPEGHSLWSYETDPDLLNPVYGGAVLNHSATVLYFGDESGTLHALDASSGQPLWAYTVPPEHDLLVNPGARSISSAPALDSQGNIYFTCENGFLYLLDSSGARIDAFGSSDSILSSPVVDSLDRVYFGSRDTYMYCLQADSSGLLSSVWETYVGDVLYCTPAMDMQGNLFVAGFTGDESTGITTTLSSLDASGVVQWSDTIASLNDSSPNIAPDGSVYIAAYDGRMHKLAGLAPLAGNGWPRLGSNRRQTGWQPELAWYDLVDYFPDITYQISYLSYVPWFGAGLISEKQLPEIRHIEHGDLWIAQSGAEGVIYHDASLARWVFAYIDHPNYLFDLNSRQWLYHAPGTSVENERWFYRLDLKEWVPQSAL